MAHAEVALATALDTDLVETRAALAAGAVHTDHARVISTAVLALPEDAVAVDPSLPGRAEKHLIDLAGGHDARALRRLAKHELHVLDPAAADEALGRRLEEEERAAARVTSFEMYDNGDGTHAGRFKIPSLHAAMVKKALEAIINATYLHSSIPASGTGGGTMGAAAGMSGAADGVATDAGPAGQPGQPGQAGQAGQSGQGAGRVRKPRPSSWERRSPS